MPPKSRNFYKVWDADGHNLTVVAAPTDEIAIEIGFFLFGINHSIVHAFTNKFSPISVIADKFWIAGIKQGYMIDNEIIEYKTRKELIAELLFDMENIRE